MCENLTIISVFCTVLCAVAVQFPPNGIKRPKTDQNHDDASQIKDHEWMLCQGCCGRFLVPYTEP